MLQWKPGSCHRTWCDPKRPCTHPVSFVAGSLGLLIHTSATAKSGTQPAMHLRPGDSQTKSQGTVPVLMLLGSTRALLSWAPGGTGEESAYDSPKEFIMFPVGGAWPDCAAVSGSRQEHSCRDPLLCYPPSEADPNKALSSSLYVISDLSLLCFVLATYS